MDLNLVNIFPHEFGFSLSTVFFDWNSYHSSSCKELDVHIAHDPILNSKKRNAAHLAGRYCAKKSLLQSGFSDSIIQVKTNLDHSPVWPLNWIGSITHTDDIACAAVSHTSSLRSIGIDIEKINTELETNNLFNHIVSKKEYLTINSKNINISNNKLFHLFFSIKESIYKCFYPLTKIFLNFEDVEIILFDTNSNYFEFIFTKNINNEFKEGFFHGGYYTFFENYVFTYVKLKNFKDE